MMENNLVKEVKAIEMSKEMQQRIIKNCYIEMEEKSMNKNRTKTLFKKPLTVAASLALCLCLTGVTALAATGRLEGFFKNITRWDGAVTGTSYEQATDEVKVDVINVADKLTVEITMLKPKVAPYSAFELFGIESYKIVDENGSVISENKIVEMSTITDGKVNVNISLDNIFDGKYKLVITKLIGSAKADQPLILSGTWECEFCK